MHLSFCKNNCTKTPFLKEFKKIEKKGVKITGMQDKNFQTSELEPEVSYQSCYLDSKKFIFFPKKDNDTS